LSYISSLCSYHPELRFQINDFVGDDIFDFFEKVAPKFFENIFECYYMGISYNCSEIFAPIITDEGLCYSFNLLNREDILSDNV
jgi:amiloride-sensitive sodium channel